jgi:hypothetical protein
MKWATVAASAALMSAGLMMMASPAAAQWSTARGTTPDTKISQCVMGSTQSSQELRLLKFGDDDSYYVHIVIREVNLPGSTRYPVPVTFDSGRTWRLNAVGARGDGGLLADMPAGDFHSFLTDLRAHNRVRLDLTSIGHSEWVMNLAGSSAAGEDFLRCVPNLT